jgi:Calcium binding
MMIRVMRRGASNEKPRAAKVSEAKLDVLIEEATVDAYDESEQMMGFHTMLDEHLDMPFKTEVLGVEVTAEKIDLTDDDRIVVVCTRGKSRQTIPLLDLPLPSPPPNGAEWIDAYRRWARGR